MLAASNHWNRTGFCPLFFESVADARTCVSVQTDTHQGRTTQGRFNQEISAKCKACGNDYDKSFQLVALGQTHTFDSFECAIRTLTPTCEHCGVSIIGDGLEKGGRMFCCGNCAEHSGVKELRDLALL